MSANLRQTVALNWLAPRPAKPPVSGFGFSHHGDLRERGRQTGLAFVKLDLGARDVNADDPSLPWMHPKVGRYFRKGMLLF